MGNVTVVPELKFVMMKSSNDRDSEAAAAMPGSTSGNVTFRNVCHSFAYRSMAASCRRGSSPARRAFTVTTTKDRQNRMCATTTVQNPSGTRSVTNNASSDEPITTSGVAIGRKISTFVVDRPRNRCRARANAISVPSTVATSVATRAMPTLIRSAAPMPAAPNGSSQYSSVHSGVRS
jgi:hypothetical protein